METMSLFLNSLNAWCRGFQDLHYKLINSFRLCITVAQKTNYQEFMCDQQNWHAREIEWTLGICLIYSTFREMSL
jgi:hypothetical protein